MTPEKITEWIHAHPRLRTLDQLAYRLARATERTHRFAKNHADPIGIGLIIAGIGIQFQTSLDAIGIGVLAIGAVIFGVFGEYGESPFRNGDSA